MNRVSLLCAWIIIVVVGDVVIVDITATPRETKSVVVSSYFRDLGRVEIKCDDNCKCAASRNGDPYRVCPPALNSWITQGVVDEKCAVNIQQPKLRVTSKVSVWFACQSIPNDYRQQVIKHNLDVQAALDVEKSLLPDIDLFFTKKHEMASTRKLVYSMYRDGPDMPMFANKKLRIRSELGLFEVICDAECGCSLNPEKASESPVASKLPHLGKLIVEKKEIQCDVVSSAIPRHPDGKHRCVFDFMTQPMDTIKKTWEIKCSSRMFMAGLDTDPEKRDPIPKSLKVDSPSTLVIVPMVTSPEFTIKSAMVDGIPYRFTCTDACNCVMRVDPELYKGPSLNDYMLDCPVELPLRPFRIEKCSVTVQHAPLFKSHSEHRLIGYGYICTSRPADNDDILTFQRSRVKTAFSNQKNFEQVALPKAQRANMVKSTREYRSSIASEDDEISSFHSTSTMSKDSPSFELSGHSDSPRPDPLSHSDSPRPDLLGHSDSPKSVGSARSPSEDEKMQALIMEAYSISPIDRDRLESLSSHRSDSPQSDHSNSPKSVGSSPSTPDEDKMRALIMAAYG